MDTMTPLQPDTDLPPENHKVLYVDDEQILLTVFEALMEGDGLDIRTLNDSREIDTILKEHGPFAAVLSDQRMPVVDGVTVLSKVAANDPDTRRIMVTGYSDANDTARAVNLGGISHYVSKPWNEEQFRQLILNSVTQYNLLHRNRILLDVIQEKNARLQELLEGTVASTTRMLSDMVGHVNEHAAQQAGRFRSLGMAVLDMLQVSSAEERWEIERAFDLVNLGLVMLPSHVQIALTREGLNALNNFPMARNHHMVTAQLVERIPRFQGVARIIRLSHKNFDGTGEPSGERVRGFDIPLGARLLHILYDLDRYGSMKHKSREVLNAMSKEPARYDVSIISRMMQAPTTARRDSGEVFISINSLVPGMVLINDVVTGVGHVLLRAGTILNDTNINVLKEWHSLEPVAASSLAVRRPD
jgi:response regulator RpfG family c-di-GMP phosphodiesterase